MAEPLSRAKLTALVQRLIDVDAADEQEHDRLDDLLRHHVLDPEVFHASN